MAIPFLIFSLFYLIALCWFARKGAIPLKNGGTVDRHETPILFFAALIFFTLVGVVLLIFSLLMLLGVISL